MVHWRASQTLGLGELLAGYAEHIHDVVWVNGNIVEVCWEAKALDLYAITNGVEDWLWVVFSIHSAYLTN